MTARTITGLVEESTLRLKHREIHNVKGSASRGNRSALKNLPMRLLWRGCAAQDPNGSMEDQTLSQQSLYESTTNRFALAHRVTGAESWFSASLGEPSHQFGGGGQLRRRLGGPTSRRNIVRSGQNSAPTAGPRVPSGHTGPDLTSRLVTSELLAAFRGPEAAARTRG